MISDSVAKASIPSPAKDLGKKKRAKTARLKQCKLDVRREQWLSQGTRGKCCKEQPNSVRIGGKENSRPLGNLETRPRREGGGVGTDGSLIHQHDSDSDSLSNSPTSLMGSVLSGNDSGTTFTGSSSSSNSSRTSVDCFSGNITEEEVEEEDDECLDDWEAMADALDAKDKHETQFSESPPDRSLIPQMESSRQALSGGLSADVGSFKPEITGLVPNTGGKSKAWRPDDTSRPQSLPNLSKQLSLPNSDRQPYGYGGVPWACNSMVPPPTSCPICYEELDCTDSRFLPCFCGFRLCLFCYKRILEEDGRCPGCRKPYEGNPVNAEAGACGGSLSFRLARSCSMITRS